MTPIPVPGRCHQLLSRKFQPLGLFHFLEFLNLASRFLSATLIHLGNCPLSVERIQWGMRSSFSQRTHAGLLNWWEFSSILLTFMASTISRPGQSCHRGRRDNLRAQGIKIGGLFLGLSVAPCDFFHSRIRKHIVDYQ